VFPSVSVTVPFTCNGATPIAPALAAAVGLKGMTSKPNMSNSIENKRKFIGLILVN
jgi:hypothetical protein